MSAHAEQQQRLPFLHCQRHARDGQTQLQGVIFNVTVKGNFMQVSIFSRVLY